MGRVLGLGGFVCLGKTAKTPDISTVTSALFLLEGISRRGLGGSICSKGVEDQHRAQHCYRPLHAV